MQVSYSKTSWDFLSHSTATSFHFGFTQWHFQGKGLLKSQFSNGQGAVILRYMNLSSRAGWPGGLEAFTLWDLPLAGKPRFDAAKVYIKQIVQIKTIERTWNLYFGQRGNRLGTFWRSPSNACPPIRFSWYKTWYLTPVNISSVCYKLHHMMFCTGFFLNGSFLQTINFKNPFCNFISWCSDFHLHHLQPQPHFNKTERTLLYYSS